MIIKFWGTRGSVPVPGKETLKYGGNTPCVEIRTDKNEIIILDCGTGIRELGNQLVNNPGDEDITILMSHYHWDHIQGLPFFKPLFDKSKNITLYGLSEKGEGIKSLLNKQMTPVNFPITMDDFKANIKFEEIEANKKYTIKGIDVETFRTTHSAPTLSFKITSGEKSFVYMTDNEINLDSKRMDEDEGNFEIRNKEVIDFCSGSDYLIHDTMYEEESVIDKKGWGHSSNLSLAKFGVIAGIKHLVLFHYNPDYSDDKIDKLLEDTKKALENSGIECTAAKEGLELVL